MVIRKRKSKPKGESKLSVNLETVSKDQNSTNYSLRSKGLYKKGISNKRVVPKEEEVDRLINRIEERSISNIQQPLHQLVKDSDRIENINIDQVYNEQNLTSLINKKIQSIEENEEGTKKQLRFGAQSQEFAYELEEERDEEIMKNENRIISQSKDFRKIGKQYIKTQDEMEISQFKAYISSSCFMELNKKVERNCLVEEKEINNLGVLRTGKELSFQTYEDKIETMLNEDGINKVNFNKQQEMYEYCIAMDSFIYKYGFAIENAFNYTRYCVSKIETFKKKKPFDFHAEFKETMYKDDRRTAVDGLDYLTGSWTDSEKELFQMKHVLVSSHLILTYCIEMNRLGSEADLNRILTPLKLKMYMKAAQHQSSVIDFVNGVIDTVSLCLMSGEEKDRNKLEAGCLIVKDLLSHLIYIINSLFLPLTDFTIDQSLLPYFSNKLSTLSMHKEYKPVFSSFYESLKEFIRNQLISTATHYSLNFNGLMHEKYFNKINLLFNQFTTTQQCWSTDEALSTAQQAFLSQLTECEKIKDFSFTEEYQVLYEKLNRYIKQV